MTKGHGGFQELDQLPVFSTVTKFQAHVNNPKRISELTAHALDIAQLERGPVQINIPRDFFYGDNEFHVKRPRKLVRSVFGLNLSITTAGWTIRSSALDLKLPRTSMQFWSAALCR